eukprot:CAMPEP_0117083498 /NCGR_PEP_ID=MMETSP0472-20121206/58793_1 /TAXON_ID=693140 ORGANISM="Tiarina fusus, Strain LIS" /NCGR_SAMPLE_ID=MMETSP0472 /ASSEMBLY_ACC=CAM_ASM_000603 /LENGTH=82 /DNA_ID=CAMNT_0004812157 /DNA_START=272 /DNA_END=520 /DNA_ORIENTATION=-
MGSMNQANLSAFYRDNVDIYVNTEPGKKLNGWPLGMEALLQGAVGIQADPHHLSRTEEWNITKADMFVVPSGKEGIPLRLRN